MGKEAPCKKFNAIEFIVLESIWSKEAPWLAKSGFDE